MPLVRNAPEPAGGAGGGDAQVLVHEAVFVVAWQSVFPPLAPVVVTLYFISFFGELLQHEKTSAGQIHGG